MPLQPPSIGPAVSQPVAINEIYPLQRDLNRGGRCANSKRDTSTTTAPSRGNPLERALHATNFQHVGVSPTRRARNAGWILKVRGLKSNRGLSASKSATSAILSEQEAAVMYTLHRWCKYVCMKGGRHMMKFIVRSRFRRARRVERSKYAHSKCRLSLEIQGARCTWRLHHGITCRRDYHTRCPVYVFRKVSLNHILLWQSHTANTLFPPFSIAENYARK